METEATTETKMDKTEMGPGPWQDEPDRVEFYSEGFPCLITRVESMGHLCGYVAVPPGHPWHGKHYDDIGADVHGGLIYAEACSGRVCHVPKPGDPADVWWLGFDHAHGGDLVPVTAQMLSGRGFGRGDVYRTVDYVRSECESLARQAKAAA